MAQMVQSYEFWWNEAKRISKYSNPSSGKLWLDPLTIFSQWAQETAYFTSNNLRSRNNLAGMTWYEGYTGIGKKGGARPANEGGYYIDYSHLPRTAAAESYVEFVQRSGTTGRYKFANVQPERRRTPDEEFKLFAQGGWAADGGYASKLKSVKDSILKRGLIKDETVGLSVMGTNVTEAQSFISPVYSSGIGTNLDFDYSTTGVEKKTHETEKNTVIDQIYAMEKNSEIGTDDNLLDVVKNNSTQIVFRGVIIFIGIVILLMAVWNLMKGNSGMGVLSKELENVGTPELKPE